MKYLGIDYGTKRIGIAVSDDSGEFAFPKTIIKTGAAALGRRALEEILDITRNESIQTIVVGNSMDTSGARNNLMEDIDVFVEQLEKLSGLPVMLQDERFSSMMARSMDFTKASTNANPRRNESRVEHIDDRAAAVMLQRYLDKAR